MKFSCPVFVAIFLLCGFYRVEGSSQCEEDLKEEAEAFFKDCNEAKANPGEYENLTKEEMFEELKEYGVADTDMETVYKLVEECWNELTTTDCKRFLEEAECFKKKNICKYFPDEVKLKKK
ncbi:uncharacterized protein LOC129793675 [Lutzomyia longipalpis]|uniref:11.6 kDa salivary protein n=1 Tax=Lutzomyia longipalpis TaxID=7200 RepID=Q5WPT3_LUTLO|nr:uncharacterized protein LOC129793675 [Lutzomyia longipalpis]AAS16912.1 11.6 kDa salivary protein [Lutzomyia longipalpis]